MKIAVAGSIATDQLMTFPGRFVEQLDAERLHQLSLTLLVDDLVIRRGGVAANICFGLAQLGLRPVLLGAVGSDFTEHRRSLESLGVDCNFVHVSDTRHTARFVCMTDRENCQIATFYAGAMAETSAIRLAPVATRVGGLDLVLVGASDPEAMLAQAHECRERSYPFAADPSQQLPRMTGGQILEFLNGAEYLLTNEYEKSLLQTKAGLSDERLLDLVTVRVTTLGAGGVQIAVRDADPIHVPVAGKVDTPDPTGGGDAFRAGFFAALSWSVSLERAAQVGSMVAAFALEHVGAQEYRIEPAAFLQRLSDGYGPAVAEDVRPHLFAMETMD